MDASPMNYVPCSIVILAETISSAQPFLGLLTTSSWADFHFVLIVKGVAVALIC